MKIAVIGAGIFGTTAAWKLASQGNKVDLYEREKDILQAASGINQYRLHMGYHYPRSDETALDSKRGSKVFQEEYKDCIVKNTENYYCISKKDSRTTKEQFVQFCKKHNLPSIEEQCSVVKSNSIVLSVKVKENIFNVEKLKSICKEKLAFHKVNVIFKEYKFDSLNNYDLVIYALYTNSNLPFQNKKESEKDFQFELCEKPIIKLPKIYKNKSVVILDGPFMCIDPLGETDYHVMGNVVHAIHKTNVGKYPEIPEEFKQLLNKGIIKSPSITNIKKFFESAKEFFIDIDKAEHIGSMYTIRTVLPERDHDDARPTMVQKISNKEFLIFSGKIGTCVQAADVLCNEVRKLQESQNINLIQN